MDILKTISRHYSTIPRDMHASLRNSHDRYIVETTVESTQY